jgi:hypothetical protein
MNACGSCCHDCKDCGKKPRKPRQKMDKEQLKVYMKNYRAKLKESGYYKEKQRIFRIKKFGYSKLEKRVALDVLKDVQAYITTLINKYEK